MIGNWRGCQSRHAREVSRENRLKRAPFFLRAIADGVGTMRRALSGERRETSTRTRKGLSLARSLGRGQPHLKAERAEPRLN